jgi:hypothetical protein
VPKGSSRSGGGGGGGAAIDSYGGLRQQNTIGMSGAEQMALGNNYIFSEASANERIFFDPVTGGSPKQNDWATSIKSEQMMAADQALTMRAIREASAGNTQLSNAIIAVRNSTMVGINNVNNASFLINTVRGMSVNNLMRQFASVETRQRVTDLVGQ